MLENPTMMCLSIKTTAVATMVCASLSGCAVFSNLTDRTDARWAGYESWTKVTEGTEPTGDFSGLLLQLHKGAEGHRDVYVNDIAKDTLLGEPPYDFPEGTVIVKRMFENRSDWESGQSGEVVVSIKNSDDGTRSANNWIWAASVKGRAGPSSFCASCHQKAVSDFDSDFVFTTADFLRKRSAPN